MNEHTTIIEMFRKFVEKVHPDASPLDIERLQEGYFAGFHDFVMAICEVSKTGGAADQVIMTEAFQRWWTELRGWAGTKLERI